MCSKWRISRAPAHGVSGFKIGVDSAFDMIGDWEGGLKTAQLRPTPRWHPASVNACKASTDLLQPGPPATPAKSVMRSRAGPPGKISSSPAKSVGALKEGGECEALNFFMVQFPKHQGL